MWNTKRRFRFETLGVLHCRELEIRVPHSDVAQGYADVVQGNIRFEVFFCNCWDFFPNCFSTLKIIFHRSNPQIDFDNLLKNFQQTPTMLQSFDIQDLGQLSSCLINELPFDYQWKLGFLSKIMALFQALNMVKITKLLYNLPNLSYTGNAFLGMESTTLDCGAVLEQKIGGFSAASLNPWCYINMILWNGLEILSSWSERDRVFYFFS